MNTRTHVVIGICRLALIVAIGYGLAQSPLAQASQASNPAVGRENPFAEIPRAVEPVVPVLRAPAAPEEEGPELFIHTVMLKFLDAKSLMEAITNMSSRHGAMATNPKNNSLIICDTKGQLERILAEIRRADKTPQQIMIEVVILDVQLGDEKEIGINWDILSDNRYDIAYRQNFTSSRLGSTIENAATIGDASAFNTTGLGGDFSVISGTIRHVLHLLQQTRQVEILASPRVMTLSGESASIEAVEELPYTEVIDTSAGGAGALTSTEFKLVGIHLNVTATLTDANDVLLTVETEQNVATGASTTEVPIVDTRRAKSSLLLKDGQLVIMGGLRRQEKTKEVDQIPILGNLPILGEFFKSTNTVGRNSELLVFLSPHIYKGEAIGDDAMSKYREITDKPLLTPPDFAEPGQGTAGTEMKPQGKKAGDLTKQPASNLNTPPERPSETMRHTLLH